MKDPATGKKYLTWYLESRWTGHLSAGLLAAAAVYLVGHWALTPISSVWAGAVGVGVAGATWTIDESLSHPSQKQPPPNERL